MYEVCFELSNIHFQFVKDKFIGYFLDKMFWIKKKGYRIRYGYPWIINPGRCQVWILMDIAIRVSMGKYFGWGMDIPDPYPTHGHPFI